MGRISARLNQILFITNVRKEVVKWIEKELKRKFSIENLIF